MKREKALRKLAKLRDKGKIGPWHTNEVAGWWWCRSIEGHDPDDLVVAVYPSQQEWVVYYPTPGDAPALQRGGIFYTTLHELPQALEQAKADADAWLNSLPSPVKAEVPAQPAVDHEALELLKEAHWVFGNIFGLGGRADELLRKIDEFVTKHESPDTEPVPAPKVQLTPWQLISDQGLAGRQVWGRSDVLHPDESICYARGQMLPMYASDGRKLNKAEWAVGDLRYDVEETLEAGAAYTVPDAMAAADAWIKEHLADRVQFPEGE